MGIFDGLRHQLIDIIQWSDPAPDTLLWHFPRADGEIKNGAQLIVREGQAAAFVNQGRLADVFPPGTYSLQTQNLPILSDLMGWKYGFNSPFKADVYYVTTRTITDRKWGTRNPIMMNDPQFGPMRLRAFGTFAVQISDPATFLRRSAGAGQSSFDVSGIENQLKDLIVARFADALSQQKLSALDLAGNYDRIARFVAAQVQSEFAGFGMQLVNLMVENISLPAEVEAAMDKRTSMGVLGSGNVGNLQAFTQYQVASAVPDAAKNPGGLAGSAAGLAMGFAMGNQMTQSLNAPPRDTPGTPQHLPPQPGGGISANPPHDTPGTPEHLPPQPSSAGSPPPLPQSRAFFVAIGGKQRGPLDAESMSIMVNEGQLTRDTLVWAAGMSSWTKASAVDEIAPLFANVPPPIPELEGEGAMTAALVRHSKAAGWLSRGLGRRRRPQRHTPDAMI